MEEGTCRKCGRLYYLEATGDRGLCCICERDCRYERLYGPDWVKIIQGDGEGA